MMNSQVTAPIDIYARRSQKGDVKQRSTTGQVKVCQAVLGERGLIMGQVHVDDGRSAWNPKVNRPGWNDLMARLESGAAGGVIVFDLERFSRKPAEGERLIRAAERGMLVLNSDTEFDLTSPSGKKAFRDGMNAAAYYADITAKKTARGKELKAMSGETNGRVSKTRGPYGFMPDGETHHPDESLIVRDLTARFLAGETQDSLVRWMNEQGHTTSWDGRWTRTNLRIMLCRPVNAGIIVYKGKEVSRLDGTPIITREQHDQILAVYAARRPGRPVTGKYLCSGHLYCGRCDKPLSGRPRNKSCKPYENGLPAREYWCAPNSYGGCGKTFIDQRATDEYAKGLTIALLSDAERANQVNAAAANLEAEAADLDEQIGRAEDLRRKLAAKLADGLMDEDEWDAARAPLTRRLTGLREKREALGTAPKRAAAATETALRERWGRGTPEERREMLSLALRGGRLIVGAGGRYDVTRIDLAG